MIITIPQRRERLKTVGALEGLFSRVEPHVHFQV